MGAVMPDILTASDEPVVSTIRVESDDGSPGDGDDRNARSAEPSGCASSAEPSFTSPALPAEADTSH